MFSYWFFNVLFVIMASLLLVLFVILTKSLKKTLYNYNNVILIASMIFLFFLTINIALYGTSCIRNNITITLESVLDLTLKFPKIFSSISLIVLSVISILLTISNLVLIKHEGFAPSRLLGLIMGLLIVVATQVLYFIDNLIFNQIITTNTTVLCYLRYLSFSLILLLCYFECVYLATMIMSYLAAIQKPKFDKDFIIILGCAINKKGGLLPLLKGRVNQAIKYAWKQEIANGKPMKFVCSGGQGSNEIMSEASAMELYLLSHSAESNEVYTEKRSTNTKENMLFSKEIIDSLMPKAKVAFSTTNFHMFRSGLLATQAGFKDIEGIASKTKWYFWPNGFIREFIALIVMHRYYHLIVSLIFLIVSIILSTITMLNI